MTASTIAFTAGGIGLLCVILLLVRLWSVGGGGEAPLGPRVAPRPSDSAPVLVPAEFRQLVAAEATRWRTHSYWESLVDRLNDLTATFGAELPAGDTPKKFSASWVDTRLAHIESAAGLPTASGSSPDRPNGVSES